MNAARIALREVLTTLDNEYFPRALPTSATDAARRRRVANTIDLNLGVTQAIRAAGMRAAIERGRYWFEPATAEEADRLRLEPGQDVLVLERVRTADGKPVVLSRDVLPRELLGDGRELPERMLECSIYDVLEQDLDIVIGHAVANLRPVKADLTVARHLGIPRGELLLAIWQVDYSQDGTAILSSYEYHLADAFAFTLLRRGPGKRF